MNAEELRYCLAKQLSSIQSLHTSYGDIYLDPELVAAVESALLPILQARLNDMDVNA